MTNKERRLRIQSVMAIISFSVGTIIACACLFLVKPLGQIETSAISVTSEFLILAGALLGISASFDTKMNKFRAEIEKEIINKSSENEELPDE
jgi:hypothetical protein